MLEQREELNWSKEDELYWSKEKSYTGTKRRIILEQ